MRLVLLLLAACAAGPSRADVAASRDRWTAVRDVTAEGAIDALERVLLDELLRVWDDKLAADGSPRDR